jgi:MFS family permease
MTDTLVAATPVRPLFRDVPVLGWAFAAGLSQLGDVAFYASLAYAAATLGSPAIAATVLACAATPRALLMLFGGAITDRVDARRLMIASDLSCLGVLLVALAVIGAYGLSAPILIAIGACFGTADAFYGPASATLPRRLVTVEQLPRLAALQQLIGRFARIGGAPLGLALVAVAGFDAALIADAASYAVIAVTLIVVRPRRDRTRKPGTGILGDLAGGFRYIVRTPKVRDMVIALSGLNVFGGPVLSIGIALRTTEQGWNPSLLGAASGCIGAGAVAGTLAAIAVRPVRPLRFALSLMFVQAAAVATVGVLNAPGEIVAMLIVGVTAGLASPLMSGTVTAMVDEEFLGRTSSVLSLGDTAGMPFALAGFGALAAATGLATACLAFGAAFAALMVFAITRPHIANLTPIRA